MRQVRKPRNWKKNLIVWGVISGFFWGSSVLFANPRTTTLDALPKRIADGFDFPVGSTGDAEGYYMARSMTPYHHMGDDWNGVGGGNSDLGDPIYAIADGLVVYSYPYGSDWGEVIIIRHKYINHRGEEDYVDSLYGHVQNRRVKVGNRVRRGDFIAEIGNNDGMYMAHLHLEIRKNIDIGIQTWLHSKSSSNYLVPKSFIAQHRPGSAKDRGGMMLAKNDAMSSMPGYDRSLRALMDRNRAAEERGDGSMMALAQHDVSDAMTSAGRRASAGFGLLRMSRLSQSVSNTVVGGKLVDLAAAGQESLANSLSRGTPNRMRTSRNPSREEIENQPRMVHSEIKEDTSSENSGLLSGLFGKKDEPKEESKTTSKSARREEREDSPSKSEKDKGGLFSRGHKKSSSAPEVGDTTASNWIRRK